MTEESPLGRATSYPEDYSPDALFPIARADGRAALGLSGDLPFSGFDLWTAWDLTWLAESGQPRAATAEIRVPADSPNVVESKSLKLYLGSFAMSRFASTNDVTKTISDDVGACVGTSIDIDLHAPANGGRATILGLPGECLDDDPVACDTWEVDAALLAADRHKSVTETLHSHQLRSLCPVTGQPDLGSVLIRYAGPKIDRSSLLQYLVSFRRHNDFHEACIERMFLDLKARCSPERLTVYARYQRRGGIDINPFRSDYDSEVTNLRTWRQ